MAPKLAKAWRVRVLYGPPMALTGLNSRGYKNSTLLFNLARVFIGRGVGARFRPDAAVIVPGDVVGRLALTDAVLGRRVRAVRMLMRHSGDLLSLA